VARQHGPHDVFHALQPASVASDEHRGDAGIGRGLEPLLDEPRQDDGLHAVGHVDDGSGRAREFGHGGQEFGVFSR
jgi:hypothetical protein